MNYRRGLQRVYAVLTVLWIAGVMFTVLTGRWEPWRLLQPKTLPADFAEWDANQPSPGWSFADGPGIPDFGKFIAHEHAKQRWEAAIGLSVLVPAMMYFLLFYVSRWIYHGFRPNG